MKVEVKHGIGDSSSSLSQTNVRNATLVTVDLEGERGGVQFSITPEGLLEVEPYDAEGNTLSQKHYDIRELIKVS